MADCHLLLACRILFAENSFYNEAENTGVSIDTTRISNEGIKGIHKKRNDNVNKK